MRLLCAVGLHSYRQTLIRYDRWPRFDTWIVNERCACGAMRDRRHIAGLANVTAELRAVGIAQMKRTDGADLIARERDRQVSAEGWTAEHDDQWADGELAEAAACYIRTGTTRTGDIPPWWPWHEDWWKPCPNDRTCELTKAGALIAAEIDRLQRVAT